VLVPPPDVVVARTLRSLTRALLVCCGAALALGLLAVAILGLSGGSADGLASGLVLLGVGQLAAIAGAGVVGSGLRRVVGSATEGAQHPGSAVATAPGDAVATPEDAAAATGAREAVGHGLVLVARALLVACVLVAAAWTLADTAAALGSLLGALVSAQVAVALFAVRRRLVAEPAVR
jgi:hypothetical protein